MERIGNCFEAVANLFRSIISFIRGFLYCIGELFQPIDGIVGIFLRFRKSVKGFGKSVRACGKAVCCIRDKSRYFVKAFDSIGDDCACAVDFRGYVIAVIGEFLLDIIRAVCCALQIAGGALNS